MTMATLTVHACSLYTSQYLLSAVSNCPFQGDLVVEKVQNIKRNEHTRVARGTLHFRNAGTSNSAQKERVGEIDVALKIVRSWYHGIRVLREAENYALLENLQGTVVPRVYGVFQGPTADGFVTCLLMDYVGPASPYSKFNSAPVDFNLLTLEKLIRIHDAGLLHGGMREDHVLLPDSSCNELDSPFLISLSNARPHRCKRALPIVEATLRPSPHVFGCDELWRVAACMGIWNPGEIAFFSVPIPLFHARTPEQLARAAPPRMQATAAGWAEALRHARSAIRAFRARYPLEEGENDYLEGRDVDVAAAEVTIFA